MKYKNHRKYFLLFLIIPAFACQLLDSLAPNETEPSVKVLPTLTPNGETTESANDTNPTLEPSGANETAIPDTPEATPTRDENAPPALPQIIPTDEPTELPPVEDVELTTYKSPAGYEFDHPTDWAAADLFGQTIVSNDAAVLESGQLSGGQTLFLVIAGSIESNGTTADKLLQEVQQDILAEFLASGVLTPVSKLEPIAQAGADGVQVTQQLSSSNSEPLFLQTTSLIRQNLYVVSISMMQETDRGLFEHLTSNILQSMTLTSDSYAADTATYGLSQGELQALNRELNRSISLPDIAQPIEFGVTAGQVGEGGITIFQFSAEAESLIALTIVPNEDNFDPTFDIVDSNDNSILPTGGLLDIGSAGKVESIENLSIPTTGDYRIVVRGFGFSSGEFTLLLEQ